ncbi:MAG: hypothetical protein U9R60_16365, partial [Bacteroidota bacterium]|nr:hypothetical protein [Bacteroidota bacterium]
MKIKNIFIFTIASLITLQAYSQGNVEFIKDNFPEKSSEMRDMIKAMKNGDKLLEYEPPRYSEALELYMQANDFNPENALLNYKVGKCYLHTVQKTKAIAYLEKSIKLDPKAAANQRYILSRAYHLNYEFDKAIDMYAKYRHTLTPFELTEYGDAIDKMIEECEDGKDIVRNPIRVFIDNIGNVVNTKWPEYSPIVSADESVLMFTSCREV